MTCIITPVNIAFSHEWDVYNAIVDGLFLLDVILIFNTAFYDEDLILIKDRKSIAKNYLTGWFTIDILAIIPFDVFLGSNSNAGDYNALVRVARFGRLYKLVKLTKIVRILKVIKN